MKELVANAAYEILIYGESVEATHRPLEAKKLRSSLEQIYKRESVILDGFMPAKKIVVPFLQGLYFDQENFGRLYAVLLAAQKNERIRIDVEKAIVSWADTIYYKLKQLSAIRSGKYKSNEIRKVVNAGLYDNIALYDSSVFLTHRMYFRNVFAYIDTLLAGKRPEIVSSISQYISKWDKDNSALITNEQFMETADYSKDWYNRLCKLFDNVHILRSVNHLVHGYNDKLYSALFSDIEHAGVYGAIEKSDFVDSEMIEKMQSEKGKDALNPDEEYALEGIILAIREFILAGIDIGNIISRNPLSKKALYKHVRDFLVFTEPPALFASPGVMRSFFSDFYRHIFFQMVIMDHRKFIDLSSKPKKSYSVNDNQYKELHGENEDLRMQVNTLNKRLENAGKPYQDRLKAYEEEVRELNRKIAKLEEEKTPIIISRDEAILDEDVSQGVSPADKHEFALFYAESHKVLIWGARDNEIKRLENMYPNLTFVDSDSSMTNVQVRGYDMAVMYVGYTNHSQYYKAKDMFKNNNVPFRTIEKGLTNHQYVDEAIYSVGAREPEALN